MPHTITPIRAAEIACLAILAMTSIRARSQQSTLAIGSTTASAGQVANLNLSLSNTGGAAPTALQFTVGYPTASISSLMLTAASSATGAGAGLDCYGVTAGTTSCLIYGTSSATLGSGQIATLSVQLAATPASSVPLTLSGIEVSDASGDVISSSGSGNSIAVTSAAISLSSLSCNPTAVTGSSSAACSVALSAATTTALSVSLSSNNSAVTVPATVTVAAGASSAQFTATAQSVSTAQTAVITASETGSSLTTSLSLSPASNPSATLSIAGTLDTSNGNMGTGNRTGATVTLQSASGQVLQTITAGMRGNYIFSGLASGTYTVTPTKAGVVFSPTSQTVTLTTANATGIDFTRQTCVRTEQDDPCRTNRRSSLAAPSAGSSNAITGALSSIPGASRNEVHTASLHRSTLATNVAMLEGGK